jgi:hypothetical protein
MKQFNTHLLVASRKFKRLAVESLKEDKQIGDLKIE